MKKTPVVLCAVLWVALCCVQDAAAFNWQFWQHPAPKSRPKVTDTLEAALRETRQKTVTPITVGAESQNIASALALYREEVEDKTRRLAKLSDDKPKLAELDEAIAREKDGAVRRALREQRARLAEGAERTRAERARLEGEIREKRELIQRLETELPVLRQQLHALYWGYFFRLLLIVAFFAGAWLLHRAIRVVLRAMEVAPDRRDFVDRAVSLVLYSAASVLTFLSLLENLVYVAAVLGFATAGIALACKDVLTALVGWFYLTATRQMRRGDLIEMDAHTGRVRDIGVLTTTMDEYCDGLPTGRRLSLGNHLFLSFPLFNAGPGEPKVPVAFEVCVSHASSWKRAEQLISKAFARLGADSAQIELSTNERGYRFAVRWACGAAEHAAKREELVTAVLEELTTDPTVMLS